MSPADTDHSAAEDRPLDSRSRLLSMGELPRRPECSKLPMQLSGIDIHRAMHNGPVVGYAHNQIMHICDMHIPGVVFH